MPRQMSDELDPQAAGGIGVPQEEGAAPGKAEGFREGDFVFAPYAFGADVIFRVSEAAGDLTFVTGDIFHEPTPVLTADLRRVQNLREGGKKSASLETILTNLRSYALHTQANDQGILRLKILREGLERLAPAILELGAGATALLVTYQALKGLVGRMIRDRSNSTEQERSYEHENDAYFSY